MRTVAEVWDADDEGVWRQALEHYWHYVKPADRALVKELEPLDVERVRRLDPEGWYEFLFQKYFRWKYTAPNRLATTRKSLQRYVRTDTLDELYQIKHQLFALDQQNIKEGLRIASQIRGLGIAGASGLLALIYPEQFATVDQFVVKALRDVGIPGSSVTLAKMNPVGLTIDDSVWLINVMRAKAAANNRLFGTDIWTPRKIDMILWTYGREA